MLIEGSADDDESSRACGHGYEDLLADADPMPLDVCAGAETTRPTSTTPAAPPATRRASCSPTATSPATPWRPRRAAAGGRRRLGPRGADVPPRRRLGGLGHDLGRRPPRDGRALRRRRPCSTPWSRRAGDGHQPRADHAQRHRQPPGAAATRPRASAW